MKSLLLILVLSLANALGYHPVVNAPVVQVKDYSSEIKILTDKVNALSSTKLGAFYPTGGLSYRLQSSVTASQVTVNLSSFKEPITGTAYTMTYLGSDIGYGTLDPQQPTRSEFISFTGITQNSDGTAQLTGVNRGLSRTPGSGGCVASTTLAQSHSGQSIFAFTTDSPCFFSEYAVKRNNEAITGEWTAPGPTNSSDIATKGYVDTSIVGTTTIQTDKLSVGGTAGETLAIGNVVYLKQSDSRWYKANVNISEASTTLIGITQGATTTGLAIPNGVLLRGLDANQSGLLTGYNYFISNVNGVINNSPTTTRIVGKAKDSTHLYVDTSFITDGIFFNSNTFSGRNTFSATSTFTATSTYAATSSLSVGSFPAYQIGKNIFKVTASGSGNFTVPSGITKVWVRIIGAGGGGGGANGNAAGESAGGGGGGGYAEKFLDLTGTSSVPYSVGAAGGGGGAGSNGSAGGTSTFGGNGILLQATGGSGGFGANSAGGSLPGGAGGIGTLGDINSIGSAGGVGSATAGATGGVGGSSVLGGGGQGGGTGAAGGRAGSVGGAIGGGGGGGQGDGSGTGNGANGADGGLIITW